MALSSETFRGDAALEAAAIRDQAHIVPGARGPHVAKIQRALNLLDNARLDDDGIYGKLTADAVLAYKRKRGIINTRYQTAPDNIVGKMTMEQLDREMLLYENTLTKKIRIIPVYPKARSNTARSFVQITSNQNSKGKTVFDVQPRASSHGVFPVKTIEIGMGQVGWFEVQDGIGCSLHTLDHNIAKVFDPGTSNAHDGDGFSPTQNRQTFGLRASPSTWGSTMLIAKKRDVFGILRQLDDQMIIVVKDNRGTDFSKRTVAHHHKPAPDWNKICDETKLRNVSSFDAAYLWTLAARRASPEEVVDAAVQHEMQKYPKGLAYLNRYLKGTGGTTNEDSHLDAFFRTTPSARRTVADEINNRRKPTDKVTTFAFEFAQEDFPRDHDSTDFRYMWGTIDFLNVEANYIAGTVKLWFEDTYEWHPPYAVYGCSDTKPRTTDFLHAALVQMKAKGAADFQMRGEAVLPMSLFPLGP